MKTIIAALQPIGRSLMLPFAVLPIASLLLRLGQPDLLDVPFLAAAGNALFANLGLLFAIGVATGMSRDGNGAAALAGVVFYLVAINGARVMLVMPADVLAGVPDGALDAVRAGWTTKALARFDVPVGIVAGLVAGASYNRYATITLPTYLSFFGGRRFVPIVAGLSGLVAALALGLGYGVIDAGIDHASRALIASGDAGLFGYGVLNRLLLVTGLHHILNNVAWFVVGDYQGVSGDLRRFFAGDPDAGSFMAGFFPVMMFGLPGACLAMYRCAAPDRRAAVGGMLASLAATSFLTGITEPIEFAFMFVAPALFAIHAVLTGTAMVVMSVLGSKLGFGFSAGLFDFVLGYGRATRPLLLLPVGLVLFGVYYGVFSYAIRRFDLATPGRGASGEAAPATTAGGPGERGKAYATALGGGANVASVAACTTRLRLVVHDQAAVDESALKALGTLGLIRPSPQSLQIVVGPIADQLADEVRQALDDEAHLSVAHSSDARPSAASLPPEKVIRTVTPAAAIRDAAGGTSAIAGATLVAGRLRLELHHDIPIAMFEDVPGVVAARLVRHRIVHLIGHDLVKD